MKKFRCPKCGNEFNGLITQNIYSDCDIRVRFSIIEILCSCNNRILCSIVPKGVKIIDSRTKIIHF